MLCVSSTYSFQKIWTDFYLVAERETQENYERPSLEFNCPITVSGSSECFLPHPLLTNGIGWRFRKESKGGMCV